jgi:hypothetical protein
MRYIKVTFANGNHLFTRINGTEEVINKYYLGNVFTVAGFRTKAISVEFDPK